MFNKNFFPTPRTLVMRMIQGIPFDQHSKVLDPSAGNGNILSVLFDQMHNRWDTSDTSIQRVKSRIFAIEIEPQLQAIIKSQGFQLIDSDFLSHVNERQYDAIIMNPPFDTGAKHLLKALEIGPYAEIRCLLNSETLNNICTKEREVLQYALSQRDCETVDLGSAFSSAERKTNVGTSLVSIAAEKRQNQFSFSYEPKAYGEKLHTVSDMANNNQLESRDVFGSLVHRYKKVKALGAQIKTLQNEMRFYANGLVSRNDFIDELTKKDYESFVDELRTRAWENLYSQTQIANYVTTQVRDQLDKDQNSNSVAAFTEDNIYALLLSLRGSLSDIRANCVQSAFDLLTKYHKENRVHIEGWKTNSAWKVNRKCILPNFVDCQWNAPKLTYDAERKLSDIEKSLCLLSDVKYSDVKNECLSDSVKLEETGTWFDSYFFRYKGFKKGTLHIEFKSKELWTRFNYEACAGRNWLGGEFGGKAA